MYTRKDEGTRLFPGADLSTDVENLTPLQAARICSIDGYGGWD